VFGNQKKLPFIALVFLVADLSTEFTENVLMLFVAEVYGIVVSYRLNNETRKYSKQFST